MHADSFLRIIVALNNAVFSADPDGVSAQIDLIGVPWLMIGEDPSSAPNGGSGAGRARRLVALPRAGIVGLVGPVRTSSTYNFKGAQSAPGTAGLVILKRTTARARLSTRKRLGLALAGAGPGNRDTPGAACRS
jgi:hypothetical protein